MKTQDIRNMGLAMQQVQEAEAVQVDELSKKTMGSYIKKATSDVQVANIDRGMAKANAFLKLPKNDKIGVDAAKTSSKRQAGIAKAVDKIVGKAKEPGVKIGKPIKGTIMKPVKAAYHGEAMDPVGKADADIDNDGDTDSSDKYLHKRRDAIRAKMKNKKGKGKVGEKAVMHGGKSGDKKSSDTMNVGEER